jgi:hypothetical protein
VGQHQIDTVAKYCILHWDAIQVRMILPFRPAIGIMGYTLEASKKDPVVVVQEVLIHVVFNGLLFVRLFKTTP